MKTIQFALASRISNPSCANSCDTTSSDIARTAALEKAEEAADLEAYTQALEKDDGIRFTTDEVTRMASTAE